jgi:endonuclease/exonuclease/phosphatase family metal-dependent hydrolase
MNTRRLFPLLSILVGCLPAFPQESADPLRLEKPFTNQLPGDAPRFENNTLRLATWNIEWFPAGQRKSAKQNVQWQIAAVSNLIQKIQPDILLTQETRNLGSLVTLNNNLGPGAFHSLASSWFYDENEDRKLHDKVQQQTGLLSKLPWKEVWEVDFYQMPPHNRPARGLLAATFEVKGTPFTVYNLHTKSNHGAEDEEGRKENYAKRLGHIRELRKDLDRRGLDPLRDKIIVAGDMNTDLFSAAFADEETLKELQSLGFTQTHPAEPAAARITLPSREGEPYPDGTFDYIFLSRGWGENLPVAQVLLEGASKRKEVYGGDEPGLASDHFPVYVDLPLP